MAAPDHLSHLRRELDAFTTCLAGDLSAAVASCGDWTLLDLADHLGRGNLWAVAAVTENRGDHRPPQAPRDATALVEWFRDTSAALLAALHADESTPAWTFFPPHTVGFWRRRRALETLVHRWDAQRALGAPGVVDPALAGDGVAEVIDTMAPRQIGRGRARAPECAVRFVATDSGASWVLGPGGPVATITGTAADLLLMLWGRVRPDDPGIGWEGDRELGAAVLKGPLVP